jgi:intein/homing endonuclease
VKCALGPFGPLSNDTEYLSRHGWKKIEDYPSSGEDIMEYSLDTGEGRYSTPEHFIVQPCEEFIHFKSASVDIMASPEHKMLVKDCNGELKVKFAGDMYNRHHMFKSRTTDLIPITFEYFNNTSIPLTEDQLRLTVAVIADGSFHKNNKKENETYNTNGCCMGFRKDRKKERLRYLLNKLNIPYKESPSPKGTVYFYFQAPIKKKVYDLYFWEASYEQRKIICDEIQYWDGNKRKDGIIEFYSTVIENVDFIQYCFSSTGVGSSIRSRKNTVGSFGKKIKYETRSYFSKTFVGIKRVPESVKYEKYGNGFKYCFATHSGFFVARRNGKVFITGNSGKSTACVMEIIRKAHEQAPGPDGIRRTRWAVVRNCFDDQTEILTELRSWQLFKDLLPTDKVASIVNDKELVFVNPVNYYKYQYNGEMIGYSNRNLDFCVTPEHNLYASMINGRTKKMYGYKFHKAEDVYGMTHYRFKTNADEYNGGTSEFSERMFEFFGFWFAEGYVGKYPRKDTIGFNWRFTVTQKDNADYVADLLSDCGFKYGKNKGGGSAFNYSIYVNDDVKALIEKLLPCGKATTKHIPNWIKNAPKGHLLSFLKGFEEGDGHTRTHKNDSTRLYTASEKLANDLQEIIFKSGGSASLSRYTRKKRIGSFTGQGFGYTLTIHQPNQYQPQTTKKSDWYKKDYSGMVYCVEVPSHVIVTRRNNIVSLSSQSYRQLCDTTIKTFMDWFPSSIFGNYRVTDHTYFITNFPGVEIEVMFRALDRPDQVSNLLSLELTGAWFNEAREIPAAIIVAMDGRINRYPSIRDGGCTWAGIILDSNPPDDDSYLYKMFEVVKPDNWEMFKQPSGLSAQAENLKHLAKNYYIDLAKGKDDMYIRVYIHGQYGYMISGKPVFTNFVDSTHVSRTVLEPIKGLDLLIGLDFGLQPACTIGQITPFGQLRILDELVSDGMAIRQFCINQLLPLLRQKYFGFNIMGFGDPAGIARAPTDESTCFDVLHSDEIGLSNISPATTNAIVPRVNAVDRFLSTMVKGEPGFLLSPNCNYLRKALNGGYHYALEKTFRSGEQEAKMVPVKNFSSHICFTAETMVLTPTGNKRIDCIKVGDYVVTPYGNRKVLASGKTARNVKVLKIILSNGVILKCTPEHEFILQDKSIAKSNALRYSDVLQNYNSWRTLLWSIRSLLNLRGGSIGFRQEIITGRKTGGMERATFTEQFGKIITSVKSLMNMTYTTLTEIRLTMIFLILKLSTGLITQGTTYLKESKKDRLIIKKHCCWHKKQQSHGINQQKEENGTENTEKSVGKIRKYIQSIVKFVERKYKHDVLVGKGFVETTVKQNQDIVREKTTFKERVLFVVQTLQRINILKLRHAPRIVQISPYRELCDTYNITVEHDHVYYANGILTCNCDSLEYLCLYIDEKQIYDKQKRDFLASLKQLQHCNGSRIGGY